MLIKLRGYPIRKVLVIWMFLLSAVAFLDRTNISIAGAFIRDELGIGNIQLGWIFSAFLIGYAAFQVVGGWLAYRFGPRRVLAAGVLWWGVFTALTTIANPHLAKALLILILIRLALGAGEAVMYPATNQFVSQWIPVAERGSANGWIFAGVGAGAGLSIPILTWIISNYGWRASFWFCAAIGIVVGLVWYAIARDRPEDHGYVQAKELEQIQATRSSGVKRQAATPIRWRAALLNRNMAGLSLSYFSFGYIAWIFFSWFFIYMAQARGVNLKANAFMSMIPFIAMTVCCLAGGWASDQISRRFGLRTGRCGIALVSFALTAIFLVIGSSVHGAQAAAGILAGGAGALYLSQSSFWAVSADIAGEISGVVSGVMNTCCQIGGALTASLTPFLASRYGWRSAFFFGAAMAVIGGLMWLLVDPRPAVEIEPI
jgi:MFS transporter, ACS family, glucarate transporter